MLHSLLIRNFRLFKTLSIERLGQVSLITGRNGSGKTGLLEALRIYAGKASPEVLDALLAARAEYWEMQGPEGYKPRRRGSAYPVGYLFYGRRLPAPDQEGIEIGPLEGESQQRLCVRTAFYQANDPGGLRRIRIDPQMPPQALDLATVGLALELTYGGYPPRLFPLTAEGREGVGVAPPGAFLSDRFWGEPAQTVFYIPPARCRGASGESLAALWDQVSLTQLEHHVLEALRIIEPKVSGIAFFGEAGRRIPVVRLADGDQRLPLAHLGNGILQVLHIALTLVDARDGFLLIDEFENSLHWSILGKLWETVFQLAEQLDVQVFATTHSRDCARGFGKAWERRPALGSLHRLEPDPECGAKALSFTLETLADVWEAKS